MIAEATVGKGFMGLATYFVYGHRDSVDPDRVDSVESRNLPTSHPQAVARMMRATARDAPRVRKPLYHLSISFDPKDRVDRATMRQVADRTLADLGLEEHQALIVVHNDRAHAHLHIMVNRVHPERGTAWSNWWDYARIERSLRAQEKALGLRVVPGKHSREPGRERAPALVRGGPDFLTAVQRDAVPHLTAGTWAELERGLAEHGLAIRVHNGGFVFTDGVRKVKASEVDRAASRTRLERRLGSLGAYRARQAVAARALETRSVQAEARAPQAVAAPDAAAASPPQPAWRVEMVLPPPQSAPQLPDVDRDLVPVPSEPPARAAAPAPVAPQRQAEPTTRRGGPSAVSPEKQRMNARKAEARRMLERALEKVREARTAGTKRWELYAVINEGTEALHALRHLERKQREAPDPQALRAAQERSDTLGEAARRAHALRDQLPFEGTLEREAADVMKPLVVEFGAEWVAHQLARLMRPEDSEDGDTVAAVERVLSLAIARPRDLGHGIDAWW